MSAEAGQLHSSDCSGSKKGASHHIVELLTRVECSGVESGQERDAIWRLRYQAYLREGVISANSSKTFSDRHDETGNPYLFGLHVDGALASSLRLHIASKQNPDCPSVEVFPDVLQPLLDAGKILVDPTRFVADEHRSRLYRGLPYATLRLCMVAAEFFAADYVLAAVRAEHQAFYQRIFDQRPVCKPRSYPHLAKPIALMMVHFPSSAEGVYRRYPFFRSGLLERRTLFDRAPSTVPLDGAPAEVRDQLAQQSGERSFAEFAGMHAAG